jgi:putative endonuclease
LSLSKPELVHGVTGLPLWRLEHGASMSTMPYTHILECSDGSYYVGSTWLAEVDERVRQHNTDDLSALYARRRRPVMLVWATWFDLMVDAFAFEKRVQGWS